MLAMSSMLSSLGAVTGQGSARTGGEDPLAWSPSLPGGRGEPEDRAGVRTHETQAVTDVLPSRRAHLSGLARA